MHIRYRSGPSTHPSKGTSSMPQQHHSRHLLSGLCPWPLINVNVKVMPIKPRIYLRVSCCGPCALSRGLRPYCITCPTATTTSSGPDSSPPISIESHTVPPWSRIPTHALPWSANNQTTWHFVPAPCSTFAMVLQFLILSALNLPTYVPGRARTYLPAYLPPPGCSVQCTRLGGAVPRLSLCIPPSLSYLDALKHCEPGTHTAGHTESFAAVATTRRGSHTELRCPMLRACSTGTLYCHAPP